MNEKMCDQATSPGKSPDCFASEFLVCCLSPGSLQSASVPIAASRASAVGILDLQLCHDVPQRSRAIANLKSLLENVPENAAVGLRLSARQLCDWAEITDNVSHRSAWMILTDWYTGSLDEIAALQSRVSRPDGWSMWLEVTDPDQVSLVEGKNFSFAGWVGRGSETGGWTGTVSAFVMAQALSRQPLPFLIQGGIGFDSAAACRIAGAAGVVLDDQLLLFGNAIPLEWRDTLRRLSAEDTVTAGEEFGSPCRFAARAGMSAARGLRDLTGAGFKRSDASPQTCGREWREMAGATLGWGEPLTCAWPVGQSVAMASGWWQRFRSVGRVVRELRRSVSQIVEQAARYRPFAAGSPLAVANGTEFPIVQGPMTRVSDCAAFASAVADAGALPMVAMALLRSPQSDELLCSTKDRLGGNSWGVGILGFVPPEIREEQLDCIRRVRPPFALISGGRPDQAAELESEGIATYLHVPVPALIRPYFEKGARRFIFEGSECGGHTGPLTSFALWGEAVESLLNEIPLDNLREISVLLAGGIHDTMSSAMACAFAGRLAAHGVRVGMLMGTAYLFTQEIVESGAVVPDFQAQAIRCRATVRLWTGPGHVIRCAPTPFVDDFYCLRDNLIERGASASESSRALGDLTLGRARAASKGMWRDNEGALAFLETSARESRGMYMMGEAAMFHESVATLGTLHRQVTEDAMKLVAGTVNAGKPVIAGNLPPEPVAIIGMSCLLPKAESPEQFWRNLLDQVNAIGEIPPSRFDWRLYFDENPQAEDKCYAKWGGFLSEIPFDPMSFGIPPRSLKSISVTQLLALEASRRALQDAGYGSGDFDRENTAVIFGTSGAADLGQLYIVRSTLPSCTPEVTQDVRERLPQWTEESFPGTLVNVMAGRVSNRLDFGGTNFAVDAACASSLAALQIAVANLQSHRCNVAISGGIDLDQTPHAFIAFSKTRALSPKGEARPFDRNADGIVLSEGVTLFVLKRLADAEKDGDRVYAVIRSLEGSSDGKAMGLTAPRSQGQRRALDRAYKTAAISPTTMGLYEAHGTGTSVGDRVELETICSFLSEADAAAGQCAIGSAKSLVGHTKAAAGAVGLMKAVLALYHRTLPPHAGIQEPLDPLLDPHSPVVCYGKPVPWLRGAAPRRAGVSAFGFGGTNFHAVLEEYANPEAPPGATDWPAELFVFSAPDAERLTSDLQQLQRAITEHPDRPLREFAFSCVMSATTRTQDPLRAAIVVADPVRLKDEIAKAISSLEEGRVSVSGTNLFIAHETQCVGGELVFLFPGQGSQYPGMGCELSVYLDEVRNALALGDQQFRNQLGARLSSLMLPPMAFSAEGLERQTKRLAATEIAQPALGVLSCGLFDFALRIGLKPSRVAGHSYGEYTALHAAGAFTRDTLLHLSAVRGQAMCEAAAAAPGAMAAVPLPSEEVLRQIDLNGQLTIANFNAPTQCVLSGATTAIDEAVARLRERGAQAKRLSVSAAFHSPFMAAAATPLARAIEEAFITIPRIPVHANFDGQPYPADVPLIRSRLTSHLSNPVYFERQILSLYEAGARVFVEIGPKDVLTGLARATLQSRPHVAVALDGLGGGLNGLLNAVAQLFVQRVCMNVPAVFSGRGVGDTCTPHRDNRAAEWFLDGGRVRHKSEEHGTVGVRPFLTAETAKELRTDSQPAAGVRPDLITAYHEYQETMRNFVASQERVLMGLLNRADGTAGTPGALAVAPAASELMPAPPTPIAEVRPRPAAIASDFTRDGIARMVMSVVTDRTGYPAELLNLDLDMEAELGIDSIKRTEVLMELERRLPERIAESLRPRMDSFSEVKSLRMLAEALYGAITALPALTERRRELPVPGELAEKVEKRPEAANCPRYIMRMGVKSLPELARIPPRGLFLVTQDLMGVAPHAVSMLRNRGADAVLVKRAELESPPSLAERVTTTRMVHGPVRAVLHLAPLTLSGPQTDLKSWRLATQIETRSLFQILQACTADLERTDDGPRAVAAATVFGGQWGRQATRMMSCAGGGVHGLLRTAALEFEGLRTRVADFSESMAPERIADCMVRELLSANEDTEIGHWDNTRVVFFPALAPLKRVAPRQDWRLGEGAVVLITGGARGITARVARELAAPGLRIAIAGRGEVGPEGIETDTSSEAIRALREELIARSIAKQRNLKPAQLEARLNRKIQVRERTANLHRLREMGAEVIYETVDVRDEVAFPAFIRSLYDRFGRIDGVIHGAGVIEDRLIKEKSLQSFDHVFETKVDGLFLLGQALRPETLKWLVVFSSVSGRFGNLGQCDYAAANEIMTRWAWQAARQWPDTRVLSSSWGPWGKIGMAAGVERLLRQRGMTPIPPDEACLFLEDEMTWGASDDCEVIAGDGPWREAADGLVKTMLKPDALAVHSAGAGGNAY